MIKSYYANPFSIDLSSMPKLSSLPINQWIVIGLPSPAVAGDGSPTFILVNRGTTNNLLIYLEGGGACYSYTTCNPNSPLRSVITLHPAVINPSTDRGGILDKSDPRNPFQNWTIIYVPYTTGDFHWGNRVVKYCSLTSCFTVYHVGFVDAIVALRWISLQSNWQKVVIAGSSAGGYGTIFLSYYANIIFKKPIVVIDDSGPGTVSLPLSNGISGLDNVWGFLQNLPNESIGYIRNNIVLYFFAYVISKYPNTLIGLYETQQDGVISFTVSNPIDFQAILLNISYNLKGKYPSNFYIYLPLGTNHTVLAPKTPQGYSQYYPLLYSAVTLDNLYTKQVYGIYVYQWVAALVNNKPFDVVQVPSTPCKDYECTSLS
ncbi:MAG: pectin acetylesterase-family hydrolase [Sulfolobaceae archaeon]